jgi:RND family efflux transporter MFP subunit
MKFDIHSISYKTVGKIALVLLLVYVVVHHCSANKAPELPTPSVRVEQPVLASLVEYVTQTGTTVAYNSVDLVARVEGYLTAIEFTDGTFVPKNKELFVIQPEPYMEQLKAAQASVDIAKANFVYTKSEYARQNKMYKQNATSLNNVEKWFAQIEESQGEVAKAVANEQLAAITYSYTHILAPFDGRIGRHLVSIGNLVGNGVATNLATIEQIDPLYVYFNLNELDLIKLREAARAAGLKPADISQVPVYIALQNSNEFKYQATLDFYDTGLNASTGTMEFRAVLTNKEHIFVPGLFVKVRVAITRPTLQLTVPDESILYDQIGAYVLVVDQNNRVVLKRVSLGPLAKNKRGIIKGLNENDQVIVEGIQNATPGNKVEPVR